MNTYYEDLDVQQGSSYRFQIQLYTGSGTRRDLGLVSDIRGKINYSYQASDSDSVSFFCAISAPASNGIIDCILTTSQTEGLDRRRYLYDVEMDYTNRGQKVTERILEGKVLVHKSVN